MAKRIKKESFTGIGTVTVKPFKTENGKKVYLPKVTKHNLIVTQGRETLMDLMLGITKKKLQYIRWGKGGAKQFPEGDPLDPLEVMNEDIDVAEFLIDKKLNTPYRISPIEVAFTETLICDEINDIVNEAAMMFEDPDTMDRSIFARITFPTANLRIEFGTGVELEWVFNFKSAKEEA